MEVEEVSLDVEPTGTIDGESKEDF